MNETNTCPFCAARQREEYEYACRLYQTMVPHCTLADTTMGVLSQIDNYVNLMANHGERDEVVLLRKKTLEALCKRIEDNEHPSRESGGNNG